MARAVGSDSPISRARLIEDLRRIGIQRGDHVAVGLSFKRIGKVEGGPETLIDALIDTIGPEGTLLMNTFTEFYYQSEVESGHVNYVFDADSTKANTGIVPERFRQRKTALRSRHPTHSVAALGRCASYLTRGHDDQAASYLPFASLAKIDGKYLAVGVGDRLVGFRHQAQQAAGLLDVVPWVRAVEFNDAKGRRRVFRLKDRGGCVKRLPDLVDDLRQHGLVRAGTVGSASAILVPARLALDVMTAILKRNPERNLCNRVWCYWCRELERRLDLHGAVGDPRYFQRYAPIVHLIALVNHLRESDSRLVAGAKRSLQRWLRIGAARLG